MDEVSVLISDLEMIAAALQNGCGLASSYDLQGQYLRLDQRGRPSPLVKQLTAALERAEGYIAEGDTDEVS